MKRTTIFLPDSLHEELRQEAFRKRLSMAALIRSSLERRPSKARRERPVKADPLLKAAGVISDGTLSEDIDRFLYET